MDSVHAVGGHGEYFCEACNERVVAIRAAWYWKPLEIATWFALVGMIAGATLMAWMALGVVFLVPVLLFTGLGLIGPVSDAANRAPGCPHCGRDVVPWARVSRAAHAASDLQRPRTAGSNA